VRWPNAVLLRTAVFSSPSKMESNPDSWGVTQTNFKDIIVFLKYRFLHII